MVRFEICNLLLIIIHSGNPSFAFHDAAGLRYALPNEPMRESSPMHSIANKEKLLHLMRQMRQEEETGSQTRGELSWHKLLKFGQWHPAIRKVDEVQKLTLNMIDVPGILILFYSASASICGQKVVNTILAANNVKWITILRTW